MANRIDSVHSGITPKPTKETSETRSGNAIRPGSDPAAAADNRGDKAAVVLTERGQRLEQLEKAALEMPAVDRTRVDAVKADIASGNYQVDVDNIADILMRTESDFND